ncbi:malectin domain-containing carbohydrate-binding protein [Thermogutta sp.]|uniref:malectin domain-containing carbohydrate-binding protein n=1 Tax=Thermogutta sp. TaxID=1962930 RepID=UPI003C7D579F
MFSLHRARRSVGSLFHGVENHRSGLRLAMAVVFLVCPIVPSAMHNAIGRAEEKPGASSPPAVIRISASASRLERLAALEVRRYLYLRTGELVPVLDQPPDDQSADVIVVACTDHLLDEKLIPTDILDAHRPLLENRVARAGDDGYLLWTIPGNRRQYLVITGRKDVAVLYGAYRLAEHYGVRFYLEGDVVPDRRVAWSLAQLDEVRRPLFQHRGIQPFHDFPEGPDWWGAQEYKAILAQLPKLGMNFIGFHCYPEGGVGPEPLVWIGQAADIGEGPRVQFSYPARHFLTSNVTGSWGYRPMKTSDYAFGADQLFEADDYGADYMQGSSPWTEMSIEQSNHLFEKMGRVLNEAFTFAQSLGIVTTVGTETPLTIPKAVRERLKASGKDPSSPAVVKEVYAAMFKRIMQTHPLDYYWFWTPENWTWSGTKPEDVEATLADLKLAYEAAKEVGAPFTLATCGWVLGPTQDRALFDKVLPKEMPVSCINRQVGHDPVEPGFARVVGRPKWAIPWLEDDPALISPQLWVGRMRKDAADALKYGCTGLMGIHWRTRQLGPNVSALAAAAWDQQGWNPELGLAPAAPRHEPEGAQGGQFAAFPGVDFADTDEDPIYQTVRYDVDAYRFNVPNGRYRVVLKFCEPHYSEAGKRVFGVKVQGKTVIDTLDIFAKVGKNRALDFTFDGVEVTDGTLAIEFVRQVEFPCIAGVVISGPVTRKINCGGPSWNDYQADWPAADRTAHRYLTSIDFYLDWASAQFGPEVAFEAAQIFAAIDGRLPRPSTWVGGPGGIVPDPRPWSEVAKEYAFVDELAALRDRVEGPGNRDRFDYWLNLFRYMRANAKLNCSLHAYKALIAELAKLQQKNGEPVELRRIARERILPLREKLVESLKEVNTYLLSHVSTYGGLGNVCNWQQHVIPITLGEADAQLVKLVGEEILADGSLPRTYEGPPRIIVPSVRSLLSRGESLQLKVILLGWQNAEASLQWRAIGAGTYQSVPLTHVARSVYRTTIPAEQLPDIVEYFIEVRSGDKVTRYPATAPEIGLTAVVAP